MTHSYRNASSGLTFAARRTGIQQASDSAVSLQWPEVPIGEELEPVTGGALRDFILEQSKIRGIGKVLNLRSKPGFSFIGPEPAELHNLARSILCSLAVYHSPNDLKLMVVTRHPELWSWLVWLPHNQHDEMFDACGLRRLVFTSPTELEEAVDVTLRKKRGRLVQHQKACSHSACLVHLRNRADNGEQRAFDGRDVGDARVRIDINIVARKERSCGAPLRAPVHRPGLALREPPEQEVLERCQTRDQPEMLVHEAHAALPEFARRERQRNVGAADLQTASWVWRMEPRQNLNERRLARTVLAEKAVHLARRDFERSLVEGLLAPKGLAQVPEPKRRNGRRARASHSYWSFHRSP